MVYRMLAFGLVAALTGCASAPDAGTIVAAGQGSQGPWRCRELYAAVDRLVDHYGVRDAQETRVAGYPYLRSDRFLVSFAHAPLDAALAREWLPALRELDRRARRLELDNLPAGALPAAPAKLAENLDGCAELLMKQDFPGLRPDRRLRAAVRVPPDYLGSRRVLGVYPITGRLALRGAKQLYRELGRDFRRPLREIVAQGPRLVFVPDYAEMPMRPEEVRDWLAAHRDLRPTDPNAPDARRLAETFAPVWLPQVRGGDDLFGVPVWRNAGHPAIDVSQPTVFYHFSRTLAFGKSLWQINYSVWFGARPAKRAIDLYAGRLDGLIWRVTLGANGTPLLYDSIHHCGCYHTLLPTAVLQVRRQKTRFEEPLFAPQTLRDAVTGERAHLYLATGTHYLQQVGLSKPKTGARTYRLTPYDELRSLPAPNGGRRSLFGPGGFVAGTERLERFVLWPLGIANTGAMRQWGHHATAFIGHRHFDDPDLIERYFLPAQPPRGISGGRHAATELVY